MEQVIDRVADAIGKWKASLLDMSASNPLLYFNQFKDALALVQPAPQQIIDSLLSPATGHTLTLKRAAKVQETDRIVGRLAGEDGNQPVSGVLRIMRERARDALLEQGIPLLYATFGQLHWEIETGDTVASPLLLLRVRLDRTPSFADYTLTAAEAEPRLELNSALRYLLQRTWNLSLDDLHPPYHLDTVMEELRHRVSGQPHWYVTPDAFLGLFPLEKFVLLEDIQQHEQTIANHPVIRALAGAAALPAPPAAAVAPSSEEWQVVDADASQRDAIAAAARGQSLIIQGPPGTGKSQTITNIIAQKLGAGQTVLFVSEKLAALDVVATRLAGVGLMPFCLAVHGDNIDEHAVAAALLEASGAGMPAAPAADPGPDLAAMKAHAEERASIQRAIDGYFAALTDRTNAWGRSAYEVIGEIANLQDAPKTQFDFDTAALGGVTSATVKQMHDALDSLAGVADICAAPREHRWHEIDRHQALDDQATRFHLTERLTAFRDRTRTLGDQQDRLRRTWGLAPGASVAEARWLWRLLADVSGRGDAPIPSAWFTTGRFTAARSAASEQVRGLSPVRGIRPDLLQRYGPAIFDVTGLDTFDAVRAVRPVLTPDPALTGEPPPPPRWEPAARIGAGLAAAALKQLQDASRDAAGALGLDTPATVPDCRLLSELAELAARGTPPCHDWFLPDRMASLRAWAQDGQARAAQVGQKPVLLARFRPEILTIDDDALAGLDHDARPLDRLRSIVHRVQQTIRDIQVQPGDLSREDAAEALRTARQIREAEAWFNAHDDDLEDRFGRFYSGAASDWPGLLAALDVADRARHLLDPNNPPPALVDEPSNLTRDRTPVDRFARAQVQAESAWALYREIVPESDVPAATLLTTAPIDALILDLTARLDGSPALPGLCAHLAACRVAPWTTYGDLARDMDEARRVVDDDANLRDLFEGRYDDQHTDWNSILTTLAWVETIRAFFPGDPPPAFVDRLLGNHAAEGANDATAIAEALARFDTARDRLRSFFIPDSFIATATEATTLFAYFTWANDLLDHLADLDRWLSYREATASAAELGLTPFLDAVLAAPTPPEQWRDAFDLQLNTLWLSWRQHNAPALTGFSHAAADRACARFAELDALCLKDNAARLVAKLSATRAEALAAGNLQAEIMALGQAAGSRVTRPLRQLFGQIPNLLSVLKPCLLMSPAAVARYLGDWTVTFDTVIFDEASQIMTADVIGSIARADQAVVVGDSRQLPPTRFFTADGASDEEPESLLDACSQVRLPNEWLLWHYRSQHEDLIAFSNHAFYGGRLVTFPSPRQDLDPIEFVPANGVFDRGGSRMNRIEAAKVVDLVIDHARQSPDDTIGIITFSEPQMTAIQHELDDRRADPEVARLLDAHDAHGLFVRNLERVQGDERDAIFFSVGYGPDAEGNFRKEFGPLNRPGGDRRLNVAITRAKKKITIVASFDPHELANYPRDGVRLLGEYLLFATQTPETRPSFTEPPARERRSFPDAVARGVSRDHSIRRDVGVGQYRIDIGVIARDDPRRCVLGIDCDGSVYAAAPDIRDRERLRPAVLTGLGWTLHRVWSLPWLNERTHELERIKELVGEREEAARAGQPPEDASDDSFPITLPGDDSPAPLEPETPVATAPDGTPPAEPPEKATKRPTGGASKRRKPAAGDTSPATPGAIKGLDAAARVALATAGITTVEQLLAAAATDAGRRALATNVGAPPAELRHWVTLADLNRIPGIGAEFAGLLDAAGIASCRELRQRNPENLREALEHLNAERKLTKQVPALARLTAWIAAADALAKNAGPG